MNDFLSNTAVGQQHIWPLCKWICHFLKPKAT